MAWQLQEAKQKFSELIRRTLSEGPQTVTKHGNEIAVVLSAKAYRELVGEVPDFKDYLKEVPDLEALELSRDSAPARTVEL